VESKRVWKLVGSRRMIERGSSRQVLIPLISHKLLARVFGGFECGNFMFSQRMFGLKGYVKTLVNLPSSLFFLVSLSWVSK